MNVGEIIVPTAEGAKGISYLLMIDGPANQIYWAGWYEDAGAKRHGKRRTKGRALTDRDAPSTDRDIHRDQSEGSRSPLRVRLRRWLHKD